MLDTAIQACGRYSEAYRCHYSVTADGTQDSLNRFGRFPLLSQQRQLELCRQVQTLANWPGGPEEAPVAVKRAAARAKRRMVETNMRLVVSVSRNFRHQRLDTDDLIQEGAVGLVRAIELFDPSRGYQFSTYAYWWIRQAMSRAVASADPIRIPTNLNDRIRRVRELVQSEQHAGRRISDAGIMATLSINEDQLDRVRVAELRRSALSLDARLSSDGDSFLDMVADPNGGDQLGQLDSDLVVGRIRVLLALLTPTERAVIERCGINGETPAIVGRGLGIPGPRVSAIYRRATGLLQLWLARQEAGLEAVPGGGLPCGPGPPARPEVFEQLPLWQLSGAMGDRPPMPDFTEPP